ncbi:GPW/gp25 family protein [Haladaptatus sp. DFWS20]|uniref:GPW/gp25 family protein n=1 Tax=Haladaptatus sp. DFWS20 TaxID=3403467 RepID=UPI003EBF0915
MSKDFLGTGWKFPVETDRHDELELSTAEADVRQAIYLVLSTAKGERIMRPDFGCGIHEYAFATIDTTTRNLIASTVRDALVKWEPRIEVKDVDVSTEELASGKLLIRVSYRIRTTNTEFNLVYPFYLQER